MKRPLRPLGRRVFVEPVYDELITPSGLHLPPHSTISPEGVVLHESHNPLYCTQGIVVAVPAPNGRPLEVAVGDFVIFSPYSADVVKVDREALISIDEADLLAVVEDEPEQEGTHG